MRIGTAAARRVAIGLGLVVLIRLHLGPYQIPIDDTFRMPIYFFSKPTGYHATVYPLARIAAGAVPAGALRNRLVLVGAYGGTGLGQDYPVPTSEGAKMDRVEIWANATQSLIQGKFIVGEPIPQTLALMLGLSLLAAIFFMRWGALGWLATALIAAAFTAVRLMLAETQLLAPAVITLLRASAAWRAPTRSSSARPL